ncbi:MAG: succinate--CoA ligase subunit alpha [Candidatus Nanoarchaeia archaeon]|nr:succinate--CoA ligase subunit alpha [Candidatus Nanoarchaeia archaeon]
MKMLINKNTKVIVQGVGEQGSFHLKLMKEYGTKVVAAISTSKEGIIEGVPLYPSVADALKEHKADFSILFVPAKFAKKAALESLNNGLNLVIITEGIPVLDTIEIMQSAKEKGLLVIGPNTSGIIAPEQSKIGIMPSHIFKKGHTAVISRSGTLAYEIVNQLTQNGMGQSIVIGIGGDPVIGFDFIQGLKLAENDAETESIVLIGEIGGNLEEKAADYIKNNVSKKVVAYIAGRVTPKDKKMGHAGAIIEGNTGTADSKIFALKQAGVKIAELPSGIIEFLK